MQRASFRVKRNIYGNLRGYIGNRMVQEFGLSKDKALEWLAGVQLAEVSALRLAHDLEKSESELEVQYGPITTQNAGDCMPCGMCR